MIYPLRKQCTFCLSTAEYEPFFNVPMCEYCFKNKVNGDLEKLSPEQKALKLKVFMETWL